MQWRVKAPQASLNGDDFDGGALPTGTASFAAGESEATITITVAGGTHAVELDESFIVELYSPTNVTLDPANRTAGAMIKNDDRLVPPPSLMILQPGLDAFQLEGDAGTTGSFVYEVVRIGDTDQLATASSVAWSVNGLFGDLDGDDFAEGDLPAGLVAFAAGESVATITVTVAGDAAVEDHEAFYVQLSDSDWGQVVTGGDWAYGLIENDDTAGGGGGVQLHRHLV